MPVERNVVNHVGEPRRRHIGSENPVGVVGLTATVTIDISCITASSDDYLKSSAALPVNAECHHPTYCISRHRHACSARSVLYLTMNDLVSVYEPLTTLLGIFK